MNVLFQKIELTEKRKFWFVKVLICKQVFHNKLLLNTFLIFIVYTSLCLISHKTYMGKCDKNISNKNCKINFLFKVKELNEIVCSSKRALCFKKRHLCMTKGHLNNPEGLMEVQSPLIRSYLWCISLIWRKKFFSRRAILTKHPIHGCFIFMK